MRNPTFSSLLVAGMLCVFMCGFTRTGLTQDTPFRQGGGAFTDIPECHPLLDREIMLAEQDALMAELRGLDKLSPAATNDPLQFIFPLRLRYGLSYPGFHGVSGFVDHNPAFPNQRLDYMGGTRTYDLDSGYNHQGTDYFLWPFSWNMVADNAVEVIAAAEGVILNKIDGNSHFNCTWGPGLQWNAVYLGHDDGSKTWYGHLKQQSLTTKGIGERVEAGEYLGVVASSGFSTGPHLHFEVYNGSNALIDPYFGPSNTMTNRSWWHDQPDYYDSAINRIMTHSAPPQFLSCPQEHVINETRRYEPGETMYFGAYYRDQRQGQDTQFRVFRPGAETPFIAWTGTLTNVSHYNASWWWWSYVLGAGEPAGIYTFDAFYEGVLLTHQFGVGMDVVSVEADEVQPDRIVLQQNFPNPFNPTTMIRYAVGNGTTSGGPVRLAVYDLLGRETAVLVDEVQAPGTYTVRFDAKGLASGLYVYRLTMGAETRTRKMTIVK